MLCKEMKVNKALIEKYHRQECSPAEVEAVEEWLFTETTDEIFELPKGEDKLDLSQAMWQDISNILPQDRPKTKSFLSNHIFWSGAAAATLTLGMIILGWYLLWHPNSNNTEPHLITINNSSPVETKHIQSVGYSIEVGPNTSASIYNKQKILYFTGSIVLRPNKDIELSVGKNQQKASFKAGQTYILFKDIEDKGNLLIINEKNLMDIPPVLQKTISTQFKI